MPKKKAPADANPAQPAQPESGKRPRLVKLTIKNFRCIGNEPVTIDLDDIVVLVGANNAGKSSVLKAYEILMSEGSTAGNLSQEDFPLGKIDKDALPEMELHTIVYDNSPGAEWVKKLDSEELLVRERWTWTGPGAPLRRGFNVEKDRWANDDDREKMPWGAAGVAKSRRPQPHRVDAFESPDKQAGDIVKLLMTALTDRVKVVQADAKDNAESDFAKLLTGIADFQKKIVQESQEQITAVQDDLSRYVGRVFPNHQVIFDAKPEDDLDKALNLFKANPQLLMGPDKGYLSPIGRQGSGARRTLLWTAIKILADAGKKGDQTQRPHVLLLDEPEICLHPNAIREACNLLYGLPDATGNWQVVVTTHSPCFIDFARDHTSIIRVERNDEGRVTGTTIFRPSTSQFDESDRVNLKMLNQCDPYVAEFFFGGKTVIVEGDTEYTAFMHVRQVFPDRFRNVQVIRARGKATIVSLCKILNQFGAPYSVLHDSDKPKLQGDEYRANPAWAHNQSIRNQMDKSPAETRLVASLTNFESAFLGAEVAKDKPYNALVKLNADSQALQTIAALLDSLLDFQKPVPAGAIEWNELATLENLVVAK